MILLAFGVAVFDLHTRLAHLETDDTPLLLAALGTAVVCCHSTSCIFLLRRRASLTTPRQILTHSAGIVAPGTADASGNGNATATPSDASTSMNPNDVIGGVRRGGHSSPHERRRPSSALRHPNDNNNGLSSSSSSSVIDGMRDELTRATRLARTALNNNGNGGENNNDVTTTMTAAAAASSFITGTAAFYATSFISQLMQYKYLKCSTGTRPSIIPSSIGMVTVAIGSWMGHVVGMGTTQHVLLCAAANARRLRQSEYYNHDAPYCNDDDSSRWRLRSIRENTSEDDDDDGYNVKRITNIMLAQLSEIGYTVWKSTMEMTRPLFLGIVSMDNHDNEINNYNIRQQLTKRQRAERKEAWAHMGRICLVGLLTYKIGCGGARFMSLSPSSYTARGSFARVSIPASLPSDISGVGGSFAYATASQRYRIEKLGRIFGCHTCGSRELLFTKKSSPKFHGDHIPPISVAKQLNDRWYRKLIGASVSQRFYPQCITCSNKQGGLLSRAVNAGHRNLRSVGGGQESYFHGRRVRLSHTTGGIVAVLSLGGLTTTGENDNDMIDLVKSSRERMQFMQHWIEDVSMKTKGWIVNVWRDMN